MSFISRRSLKMGFVSLATMCCAHIQTNIEAPTPQEPQYRYEINVLANGDVIHTSHYLANRVMFLYDGLDRELPLCLLGKVVAEHYFLNDVALPLWVESTSTSASFNPVNCQRLPDYIGLAHNHPGGDVGGMCAPSLVDMERFYVDLQARVEMVVCWADREQARFLYNVFTKVEREK